MTAPNRSLQVEGGEGTSQGALDFWGPAPRLSAQEAGLGAPPGPSHTHPAQQRQLHTVDHIVSPNMLPRTSHRPPLTLTCIRVQVPSKNPQISIPYGELWTASEQGPISFASGTSKESSWQAPGSVEANSALCGQHPQCSSYTVAMVTPKGQPT